MGYDCHSTFPKGTRKKDVEEFLFLLGYQRGKKGPFSGMIGTPYYFFKEDHYRYTTGVYSELYTDAENDNQLVLWTRTTIWRSKFDSDFHNHTIRQLKKRFGGSFESDFGKNRYFTYEGPIREKAEAGVYRAFERFSSNLRKVRHFVQFANLTDDTTYKIQGVDFMDSNNPRILSANIIIPYVVSAVEDFFRSSYIALLSYSPNKERIIGNANLKGKELVAVHENELSIPEAIAKWMSFQDMNKINQSFKELNKKYDVHGILQRPYGRRKETFWHLLQRITEQRHTLIHQATITPEYHPDKLNKDVKLLHAAIWRFYQELVSINKWHKVEKWEF